MDTALKRQQEQALIEEMIALYCKKKHKSSKLCPDCSTLKAYAEARSARCPYMETKTFCSNCKTHCYKPDMRERIRAVMRFSGPRIIFRHPVLVIKHAYHSRSKTDEATKV